MQKQIRTQRLVEKSWTVDISDGGSCCENSTHSEKTVKGDDRNPEAQSTLPNKVEDQR
jgi:hypothetical protein